MDNFLCVKAKGGKKQSRSRNVAKKGIKVVYISSPMKVETSASKFRALVQELTGKDSDAASFMDINNGGGGHHDQYHHDRDVPVDHDVLDHHHRRVVVEAEEELAVPNSSTSTTSNNSNFSYESSSPAGSDSIFESFDKYLSPMDGSFLSMFQPNFLYDSTDQLDFFQLEN